MRSSNPENLRAFAYEQELEAARALLDGNYARAYVRLWAAQHLELEAKRLEAVKP